MTAKEKAKELVDNFIPHVIFLLTDGTTSEYIKYKSAKECALIAVGEIIKVLNDISIGESGTTEIDYGQSDWKKVKEEINKL